jgi:hypothetical protein
LLDKRVILSVHADRLALGNFLWLLIAQLLALLLDEDVSVYVHLSCLLLFNKILLILHLFFYFSVLLLSLEFLMHI